MPYCSTPLTIEFDIREIITVHYFEYMKDFVFSGEAHDFWEFLYVDKGEITVQADHSIYHLKAGDVIFHPESHGKQGSEPGGHLLPLQQQQHEVF